MYSVNNNGNLLLMAIGPEARACSWFSFSVLWYPRCHLLSAGDFLAPAFGAGHLRFAQFQVFTNEWARLEKRLAHY